MEKFSLDILHKEDEVFQRLYQILEDIKETGFFVERSSHIGPYILDLVISDINGYFAVIEVKYSLENKSVCNRACDMTRYFMKHSKASYGYVTDGQKAFYIDSEFKQQLIPDFYAHIKQLLIGKNYKEKVEVSPDEVEKIKEDLLKTYDELEHTEPKLYVPALKSYIGYLKSTDFIQNNKSISLSDEKERSFMGYLLGHYYKDYLCRYTSMSGLFRTIDSEKHSMVCLVGMNDKGETNYINSYMERKGIEHYYSTPINKLNNLFILSCCGEDKEDDLTMFRLYGDDSRGVCLKYSVKKSDNNYKEFLIAPVSYADSNGNHPKLDFFIAVSKIIRFQHFDAWLHFFKSFDYKVENEVRLLFENTDKSRVKKWVNIASYGIICPVIEFENKDFPLLLDKVILGSNCLESDVNKSQIEIMAKEKGFSLNLGIDISKKNSYRVSN